MKDSFITIIISTAALVVVFCQISLKERIDRMETEMHDLWDMHINERIKECSANKTQNYQEKK